MAKKEKELFFCDPEKNVDCAKQECHLNGGACFFTVHKQYALDQERTKNLLKGEN